MPRMHIALRQDVQLRPAGDTERHPATMSACTVSAAFVATPSLRASSLTPFAAPCARRLRTVQPCLGRRSVRHTPRLCTPPPDTAAPAASTAETDVSDSTTTIVASSPPGLAANSAPLDPGVLFGEFISTFLLVLFSILLSSSIPGLPLTPDGLLIAALATAFIPVSGAHFNPAVTLALLATRRVAPARAVAFIALQLIASVLAALLAVSPLLAVPLPLPFPPAPSLAREALAMFWVVAIVFLTAVAPKNEGGAGLALAPVYIGAAVAIAAAALPGTVFNPARMFGPALVNGAWAGTWILWLGPFIGALAAAFVSCRAPALALFLAPFHRTPVATRKAEA